MSKNGTNETLGGLIALGAVAFAAFWIKTDDPQTVLTDLATDAAWLAGPVAGGVAVLGVAAGVVKASFTPRKDAVDHEDHEIDDAGEWREEPAETTAIAHRTAGGRGEKPAPKGSILDGEGLVPFLLKVMGERRGCHLDELVSSLSDAGEHGWQKKPLREALTDRGIKVDPQTNLGPPWGNKLGVKRKDLPPLPGEGEEPRFRIEDTPNGGRVIHRPT